jgi:acetaldehyde dehydrogenase (acetylating)
MPEFDTDLRSIQEVRNLAIAARQAQREFFRFSQEQVDKICAAMADAAYNESARLAQMAVEETTYGVPAHKVVKNQFASKFLWESLKDVKTVGVIRRDDAKKIVEIGWPVGVLAGFTPSTNPTSTAMFKVLIAVKARNAMVISPHPSAVKCTSETVRVMAEAGERAGMPKGLVSCLTTVTMPALNELMKHWAVSMLVATGGEAVVRAAHSSGKPAIGVGPGNVPVYVDRSADIPQAADLVVKSKSFDWSTICATEQSVVADAPIEKQLAAEMEKRGAYFMDDAQIAAMSKIIHQPNGLPNPKAVGKSPQALAQMAGISVPSNARVLIARLKGVGPEYPLSREKLTSVLGWYVADGWEKGCERCIELLKFGGDGHTLSIHCRDENIIMQFGLEKPAFRIVVNTMATLGAVGFTTNLDPSMTLATGGIGGGVYSDNIHVKHVLNIKRIAYGVRDWNPDSSERSLQRSADAPQRSADAPQRSADVSDAQIEEIVRRVLAELKK